MSYHLGIDLGGTNIAASVISDSFEILSRVKRTTDKTASGIEIILGCAAAAKDAAVCAGLRLDEIESVGLGSPGAVNPVSGVIEYANNLSLYNTPAVKILEHELGMPAYIENDANAAAYGEYVAGSARGVKDAVCITLGTGVGGGVIINKKIYSGFNHAGAELGHMVIDVNGPECSCGRRGCFEVFSSATGLVRMTEQAAEAHPESLICGLSREKGKISAKLAFEAMRMGDAAAREVVCCYIKYLAAGVANVINIFQPEVLCIGGGVCNEGDALLQPLKRLVAGQIYTRRGSRNTNIVTASLGNDAGIIGAAMLYRLRGD